MLPKGLLKEHWRALSLAMRAIDFLIVFYGGLFAYYLRFNDWILTDNYLLALLTGAFFAPITFSIVGIYSSVRGKGVFNHIAHLLQAIFIFALWLSGMAALTKTGELYSRQWFLIWLAVIIFFVILFRFILTIFLRFMRSHGLNERRVVILGAGTLGARLASTVQQALWTGFRIVRFLDDNVSSKPQCIHQIPVMKTPDQLGNYIKNEGIDEIWLALPFCAEARVREILHELRHHTITTRFVLDIFGLDLLNHSMTDIAGFPVLNIRSTPMIGINRMIKAVEDRVIAFMILLLISPLMFIIAAGIKLTSKGPIFFKQKRLGWDGRVIKVYKFRTMLLHQEKKGILTQATAKDARITRFGRFLRRTSLDELPQFINVLQGRMSIVGPRPHALEHNEQYKDIIHTYMQRHRVKPGITGWAQVNGWRGETDTLKKMEKRVEYDLYYINNWSLTFDLKIIFMSFFKGFVSPNAY